MRSCLRNLGRDAFVVHGSPLVAELAYAGLPFLEAALAQEADFFEDRCRDRDEVAVDALEVAKDVHL